MAAEMLCGGRALCAGMEGALGVEKWHTMETRTREGDMCWWKEEK